MVKIVEVQIRSNEDGSFTIGKELMKEMKIEAGEMVHITYLTESQGMENEQKTFLITERKIEELDDIELQEDTVTFKVPVELLQQAGINEYADLDIECRNREIVVKERMEIPEEVYKICEDLGIRREKVESILREGGESDEQ